MVIVFHVVREQHELGEIDEAAELGIAEAAVDAAPLGKDTVTIIRLFDLDEDEGHSVDEDRDVRSEFLVAVSTGEFRDNVEGVPVEILEIDQFDPRLIRSPSRRG